MSGHEWQALKILLWVTFAAGVLGTGLGGLTGAVLRRESPESVSLLLSFAAGVMVSIVCFDLVPGALATRAGLYWVILGIGAGVLGVWALNSFIDRHATGSLAHGPEPHPHTHDRPEELIHADYLAEHCHEGKLRLFIAGVVMASAIALHNIPEGMTIGASFVSSNESMSGATLALTILIGLHNIPEGMAVAVPLISGGMGRTRAVILTALTGIPIMLGAVLGWWLGEIGPLGLCLSLALASGAMLYVVFGEIFPQAILLCRSKIPAFSLIVGMLFGLWIIEF